MVVSDGIRCNFLVTDATCYRYLKLDLLVVLLKQIAVRSEITATLDKDGTLATALI